MLIHTRRWAFDSKSKGRGGNEHLFSHPFLVSLTMFFGEFLCLFTLKLLRLYYRTKQTPEDVWPSFVIKSSNYNPLVFALPAVCDVVASSITFLSLDVINVYRFQMLKGFVIIFTGVLSTAFLRRNINGFQWLGIGLITSSFIISGLPYSLSDADARVNRTSTGELLLIIAMIINATQNVMEELLVTRYNVPALEVVGWEGFFGSVVMAIVIIPMNYINDVFKSPIDVIEDTVDAFIQMSNNWQIGIGLLFVTISFSFSNFAGVSITKEESATTRTVMDTIRIFTVWIYSLIFGAVVFQSMQAVGFFVFIVGICLYNNVVIRPIFSSLISSSSRNSQIDPVDAGRESP